MITPIDLQVNMNQVHEIGRAEQSRNTAVGAQQNFLDDEASRLANQKKERLEESQQAEHAGINDSLADEKEEKRRRFSREREKEETVPQKSSADVMYDDRLGREIDIFK
ncbi:MAG: hypothetical protein FWG13_05015 [Leptospirales bacterium]|nr:hypothetical protein [Leptospirales bacterium]